MAEDLGLCGGEEEEGEVAVWWEFKDGEVYEDGDDGRDGKMWKERQVMKVTNEDN